MGILKLIVYRVVTGAAIVLALSLLIKLLVVLSPVWYGYAGTLLVFWVVGWIATGLWELYKL